MNDGVGSIHVKKTWSQRKNGWKKEWRNNSDTEVAKVCDSNISVLLLYGI